MRLLQWLVLAALALPGCESSTSAPAPRIWTMQNLREEASANGSIASFAASDWVTLRGNQIPLLSPPYGTPARFQSADRDGLNVLPAFSEGKSAAYAVAEVWQNIPQVWIQPWYRLVTNYNAGSSVGLANSMAIVDLDATSWFYSPFWETVYVVVPPDTAADKYLSAGQLFQDNLEMHRGGSALLAPLAPNDILPAVAQLQPGPALPIRPLSNELVGTALGLVPVGFKGAIRNSTIFSIGSFTWDSTGVVEEVPLFVFSKLNDAGRPVPFGLPSVIGTGPLRSNTPARFTSAGVPQFGGLSRVYFTVLPPSAGVFIPSSQGALRQYFVEMGGIRVDDPGIESGNIAKDYVGRVALNSGPPDRCFMMSNFPSGCQWLDSQYAIETNLAPANLLRQETLLTSPILFYNGVKVGRPVPLP